MDDSGSFRASETGQRTTVTMKQGIDERARSMARTGMYNHALGFVDHGDVLIFVDNVQRDRFRHNIRTLFAMGWQWEA